MTVSTLRELAESEALFFNDGYRTKRAELGFPGFPILRVASVGDGRIEVAATDHVHESLRQRIGAKLAEPGDIVVTTKGTVGRVARIDEAKSGYVYSPQVCFFRIKDKAAIDPDYFYYWLASPSFSRQIEALKAQTDMADYVNLRDLNAVRFEAPDPHVQQAVGQMLRTLDDKIELNRRMNETLEGIARAIFKSWFVTFDPVRVKMEGDELSGMDPVTAELFPRELIDSPQGPMPAGWCAATIGDIADVVRGRSYKSSELNESRTALVTLKSFLRGGGYRTDGLKPFTGAHKLEQVVAPGEVVVACTDVTQAAEVVGRPAVVLPDERFETLVPSLDVVVIRPRAKGVGRAFLYFLLESEEFRAHTYAHTSGTTVLHLDRKCIPDFPFVTPPGPVLEAYDRVASPSFQRIASNVREIALLESLRDAILPKLVSGQIRLGVGEEVAAMAP